MGLCRSALIMSTLRDLGIALVSVPNFSLFLNVPRPDNLHSMKRIALGWAEFDGGGSSGGVAPQRADRSGLCTLDALRAGAPGS